MSRFQEGDEDGEFNPWGGWRGRALSGRATNAMLKEFLTHLDAMPVKRIAFGTLKDAQTGDMCAVGEFAKMRGVSMDEIEQFAKDNSDYEDQRDGPTVTIGRKAGLPMTIAWDLAFQNDIEGSWVDAEGPTEPPCCKRAREYYGDGRHVCREPYRHRNHHVYVQFTPEERWHQVRLGVVSLIEESDAALRRAIERRKRKAVSA